MMADNSTIEVFREKLAEKGFSDLAKDLRADEAMKAHTSFRVGGPAVGKKQIPTDKVVAGDIGAVAKLVITQTNDTLCDKSRIVTLTKINFPTPCLSMGIVPKARGEVIVEMKARNQREIETLNQQLESEKLRIETEYVEIRKRALEERKALEKELEEVREQVEIEKKRHQDVAAEQEKVREEARKEMAAEREEMIKQAKKEQEAILASAHQETEQLAIQVRKEYEDAMARRQQLIDEAQLAESAAKEAIARRESAEKDYKEMEASLNTMKTDYEAAKKKLEAEAEETTRKMLKEGEDAKAASIAEGEQAKAAAVAEAQQVLAEVENTKKQADAEMQAYVAEAQRIMAEVEKAQATQKQLVEESEPVTPTRMTEEDYRQLENADTVYTEQSSGSETQPQQENKYFRPQTATGLLTANIVVLVLAVLTFCNSLGVTGIAIICSIIGIINAAKVKDCRSDAEVSHRKGTATFMLTLGIISLVIGFVVLIILKIIGSLAHGLYSLIF